MASFLGQLRSLRSRVLARGLVSALMAWLCLALLAPRAHAGSRVYPATAGEPLSKRFQVTVDGQPTPSYIAYVGSAIAPSYVDEEMGKASFTSFDIDGVAQVSVTFVDAVVKAKVLPKSSGITPTISGHQVTFAVTTPGQFTVELNDDWNNSLHLFVNDFETNVPSPTDPNVLYFQPGIYQVGNIVVAAGQTVYLAPGAFVYAKPGSTGPLFTLNGDNITLRGRGVIDGSQVAAGQGNLIYVYHKSNIQVEGVTLRDSSSWTFHLLMAQNVQVDNIKVFGWRLNSDGIDIDSSQNVNLAGSFFRTYDDLVAVKTNNTDGVSASNIQVTKCVLWNEVAHALTVGSEVLAPVQNVLFSDSDIIHDKGRMALLAVYNGDSGLVQNVTWSDLRITETQRLISVGIVDLAVSQTTERGSAANIAFSQIDSPTPERAGPNVDLEGFDATHGIQGVLLRKVTVAGKYLGLGDVTQNPFVTGVVVNPD